jgi:DNA-binding NarL/FixJ family response regulator
MTDIRVAIVDDQELVRMGLRMVLDAQPDVSVVAEAGDGAAAVALAARGGIDVMLMDVRMPGLDGIAATERITAAGSAPRILVLTTFDLDEYAFAALRAGASGFLLKDARPPELLGAIRAVHSGDAPGHRAHDRDVRRRARPGRRRPPRRAHAS